MASNPDWGAHTTATEVAKAFANEIKGKNVVVTGVSPGGIGATTAQAIASKTPGRLILASRTTSKLQDVASDINQKYPFVPVLAVILDLSSLDSVKQAAAAISNDLSGRGIDVLINNAGVSQAARDAMTTPSGTVVDKQLFVNHLSPFLLTSLLLPSLKTRASSSKQGQTRIINLSSHGHSFSPIRFSDYAFEKDPFDESVPKAEHPDAQASPFFHRRALDGFPAFLGYGQSKCANILHATELSRRYFKSDGIAAFSVHPGLIETKLSRNLDDEGRRDILESAPKHMWKTADEGAATTLVAAFDPALALLDVGGDVTGYFSDCQLRDDLVVAHAKDKNVAKRLWEESERMLDISTKS